MLKCYVVLFLIRMEELLSHKGSEYLFYSKRYGIWTVLLTLSVCFCVYWFGVRGFNEYKVSVLVQFHGVWKDFLIKSKQHKMILNDQLNENNFKIDDFQDPEKIKKYNIQFVGFRSHLFYRIIAHGNDEKYLKEFLFKISNKIVTLQESLLKQWRESTMDQILYLKKMIISIDEKIQLCEKRIQTYESEQKKNDDYLQLFASYISLYESKKSFEDRLIQYQHVYESNSENQVYLDTLSYKQLSLGYWMMGVSGVLFFIFQHYLLIMASLWKQPSDT